MKEVRHELATRFGAATFETPRTDCQSGCRLDRLRRDPDRTGRWFGAIHNSLPGKHLGGAVWVSGFIWIERDRHRQRHNSQTTEQVKKKF